MKSEKGEVVIVYIIILAILIIVFIGYPVFKGIYSRTVGNKTSIDLKYNYEKAIVNLNGEKLELDIDTWSDYEGEQIQIITKDGRVYLVSSFNTILIGE